MYVFVQLLQKYVRVKYKNICLHKICGVDLCDIHNKKCVRIYLQTHFFTAFHGVFYYSFQYFLSRLLYITVCITWASVIISLLSISATVRATFIILS